MCSGPGMTKNQGILHIVGGAFIILFAVLMMMGKMSEYDGMTFWVFGPIAYGGCAIVSGVLALMGNDISRFVGIASMVLAIMASTSSVWMMIVFGFTAAICDAASNLNQCYHCDTETTCDAKSDCIWNGYYCSEKNPDTCDSSATSAAECATGGKCTFDTTWSSCSLDSYAYNGCDLGSSSDSTEFNEFCDHMTMLWIASILAFAGSIMISVATCCNLCCQKEDEDEDDS
jgi:hypothetical protein